MTVVGISVSFCEGTLLGVVLKGEKRRLSLLFKVQSGESEVRMQPPNCVWLGVRSNH